MWYNICEFLVGYSVKEGSDFILLKLDSTKNFIGQFHTSTLPITVFSFSEMSRILICSDSSVYLCSLYFREEHSVGFFSSWNIFSSIVNFLHSHLNDYCSYCSRRIILIYILLYEIPSLNNNVLWREIYFRSPKASPQKEGLYFALGQLSEAWF